MTHPAIKRGHYEARTFRVARVGQAGEIEFQAPLPLLLRVVRPDLDMAHHLTSGGRLDGPAADFGSVDLVQTVAPFLREGLLDPGNGRENADLPPVHVLRDDDGLSFVQVVACLN